MSVRIEIPENWMERQLQALQNLFIEVIKLTVSDYFSEVVSKRSKACAKSCLEGDVLSRLCAVTGIDEKWLRKKVDEREKQIKGGKYGQE